MTENKTDTGSTFRQLHLSVHWNHLLTQHQAGSWRPTPVLDSSVDPRHEACTFKQKLEKIFVGWKNLKKVRKSHSWFCEHYYLCNKNIILEDQMGTGIHSLEKWNKEKEKEESHFQRHERIVGRWPQIVESQMSQPLKESLTLGLVLGANGDSALGTQRCPGDEHRHSQEYPAASGTLWRLAAITTKVICWAHGTINWHFWLLDYQDGQFS